MSSLKNLSLLALFLVGCFIFASCNKSPSSTEKEGLNSYTLIDKFATAQTQALYQNLAGLAGKHSLFGHQATLAYGYSWQNEANRSDVKDVTGSYPALYGWDIADFLRVGQSEQAFNEARAKSLRFAEEGLSRGGVLTYAWHMANPVTNKSFYDTTRAVYAIIPGGELHEAYKIQLDSVASFFQALSPMPVIFRPFHEHNGDWFWWCKSFITEEEYVALWRFTVEYLRDEKGVHNVIWAFSPDRSRTTIESFKEDYYFGYPGDEYVDIFGLDNYWDVGHKANNATAETKAQEFIESLSLTAKLAAEKNKIAALTETGLEAIPDSLWWTETILKSLQANEFSKQITYVQVWRNATKKVENRDHYYAPYPGQTSAPDFIRFKESDFILFEDELPPMYSLAPIKE